ncbi:hypothetical protein C943_03570 [Mariniradius saccharolyticus AK6]|uniref:Uncharacterized protein n=1 Tax=Mariniradius saccharolyticus AK6 TaxID=1239962 RepID=M7YB03_9BACT|nr:hypothetical protein C943_03570 [Mariniradius saccharolyticus AK6]
MANEMFDIIARIHPTTTKGRFFVQGSRGEFIVHFYPVHPHRRKGK